MLQGLVLAENGSQLRVGAFRAVGEWDAAPPGGNDAMLRWLEHYADALHQRLACCQLHQGADPPREPVQHSISLYPVKPPWQVPTLFCNCSPYLTTRYTPSATFP